MSGCLPQRRAVRQCMAPRHILTAIKGDLMSRITLNLLMAVNCLSLISMTDDIGLFGRLFRLRIHGCTCDVQLNAGQGLVPG